MTKSVRTDFLSPDREREAQLSSIKVIQTDFNAVKYHHRKLKKAFACPG